MSDVIHDVTLDLIWKKALEEAQYLRDRLKEITVKTHLSSQKLLCDLSSCRIRIEELLNEQTKLQKRVSQLQREVQRRRHKEIRLQCRLNSRPPPNSYDGVCPDCSCTLIETQSDRLLGRCEGYMIHNKLNAKICIRNNFLPLSGPKGRLT